ncbi:MAG: hypothetical protein ACYC0J_07100 [Gammaproteobacteria bacterium]
MATTRKINAEMQEIISRSLSDPSSERLADLCKLIEKCADRYPSPYCSRKNASDFYSAYALPMARELAKTSSSNQELINFYQVMLNITLNNALTYLFITVYKDAKDDNCLTPNIEDLIVNFVTKACKKIENAAVETPKKANKVYLEHYRKLIAELDVQFIDIEWFNKASTLLQSQNTCLIVFMDKLSVHQKQSSIKPVLCEDIALDIKKILRFDDCDKKTLCLDKWSAYWNETCDRQYGYSHGKKRLSIFVSMTKQGLLEKMGLQAGKSGQIELLSPANDNEPLASSPLISTP